MKRSHTDLKRFFDVFLSLLAMSLTWPLWIVVAILIKLDSKGPVFFRQLRLGKNGRPFKIFKFRTMYQNAPFISNLDGSGLTDAEDPRVTRIGKFLRKYSIDELPQFLNVINGEMSIVGPRPELLHHLKFYTPVEKKRLLVKPGMTGLAQISGRNSLSWKERKKLDILYVKNISLKLDFKIMIKTIPLIILGVGVFKHGGNEKDND